MTIWIIPLAIVFTIIGLIGWNTVRKRESVAAPSLNEQNHTIPKVVEEHQFSLHPIFWVIVVAALFMKIVIFYYWASSI
ncbi:hypothetical protein [Sporosarcina sp. UB5]|uniref:hypothetical protein n=1 Tax=Sporosarcina sp. UB5 TaxID=3047463 RepID=UPI003D7AAA8E